LESPSRDRMRFTLISEYCAHAPPMRPSELSNTSSTEARLTGFLSVEPLKITSCMCSPRNCFAEDSPSTQRTASITFDLPQPLGPTTPTSCPGTAMVVGSTKDLKPESFTEISRKGKPLLMKHAPRKDRPGAWSKSLFRMRVI